MNTEQKKSTRLLINALGDVYQTLGSRSRPSASADSGYASFSSGAINNNDTLEQFTQNIDQGNFTAAADSLGYLLTIYQYRIKNKLDPLQFDKTLFKETLKQPITDEEILLLSGEGREMDDNIIKELHISLQNYEEKLLGGGFVRSQTNRGVLGHQRNQLLDQINDYLFQRVPTLYSVLLWSYRFSDNPQLAKIFPCLEKLDEKTKVVITELSIASGHHSPLDHIFRVQAKIWRDVSGDGINNVLDELRTENGIEKDDEIDKSLEKRYLAISEFGQENSKINHRVNLLLEKLINNQSPQYQKPIAEQLFSHNSHGHTLLETLERHPVRDFDSAWKGSGRYGHDSKMVSTVLKTIAVQPEKEQILVIKTWLDREIDPKNRALIEDTAKKNELTQLMAQMGDHSSQGLPATGEVGTMPVLGAPNSLVTNPL